MLRHQLFRGPHREAPPDDFIRQQPLLLVCLEREQHFRVAHRHAILHQPALHFLVEFEQPHRVRHRCAAFADLLRDLLLLLAKFPRQPREGARFFDRVEVFALEILDQRQLEHVAIARFAHDDRRLGQPAFCAARHRRSPAMSSNRSARTRTMSGWMIPCSLIDVTSSSRCSSRNTVRG